MLVRNVFGKPYENAQSLISKPCKVPKLLAQYPKKYKFYWTFCRNFSFLLDMENEQTLNIPEFHFCTKLSRPDPKNTRIRILYPKNTMSIIYTLPWKCPPGTKINYLYADWSFAFCMTKRLFPLGRQKKMESSTSEKTALIHQTKEIPYIKTNLHTGCLRKIAN